jgi:hypothetical protein
MDDSQLLDDVSHVVLHCVLRDVEGSAHLSELLPTTKLVEHFHLAVGETGSWLPLSRDVSQVGLAAFSSVQLLLKLTCLLFI